jgi:hypothetical protein
VNFPWRLLQYRHREGWIIDSAIQDFPHLQAPSLYVKATNPVVIVAPPAAMFASLN